MYRGRAVIFKYNYCKKERERKRDKCFLPEEIPLESGVFE